MLDVTCCANADARCFRTTTADAHSPYGVQGIILCPPEAEY